jgi:hypothetical protein
VPGGAVHPLSVAGQIPDSPSGQAPADRPEHVTSEEQAMSPIIMIDLVRAIDDDRRRPGRPLFRLFRRGTR